VSEVVSPPQGTGRSFPFPPRRRRGRAAAKLSAAETLLLLVPALIPIVALSLIPLARGIYLGFTDAHAGFKVTTHWAGLANFHRLIHDSFFVNSFKIGFIWAISVTVVQFALALGLALLLNTNLRGRWIARSLALVPWAMPPVVVGIMWKIFYQPQAGLLNEALRRGHLPGEHIDWLANFKWALPAVIVVGVWAGMPQTTVALLAGLQGIAGEMHEAAAVDGATTWRRFIHITLPQLRPVILAITSIDFIWNFNSFGLVYVLTEGGPGTKTQLPMLFAYNSAFKYGEFGYASALGDAMVVVIAVVLSVYMFGRLKEAVT
jgi:multiple sugar transport system permease protein